MPHEQRRFLNKTPMQKSRALARMPGDVMTLAHERTAQDWELYTRQMLHSQFEFSYGHSSKLNCAVSPYDDHIFDINGFSIVNSRRALVLEVSFFFSSPYTETAQT